MICKCKTNSGQKRLDGVPAKSAADSVSQGGFPLGHQILKGALPPSKNGIKPFWGGPDRPSAGRGLGTQPAGFSAGCRALVLLAGSSLMSHQLHLCSAGPLFQFEQIKCGDTINRVISRISLADVTNVLTAHTC